MSFDFGSQAEWNLMFFAFTVSAVLAETGDNKQKNKTYVIEPKPQDDNADLSAQQALLLLRKKLKTYNGLYIPTASTLQGSVIIR